MKRIALILLLVMLVSVVLTACGGGGPEDVVKDYYKAFEKKDAGKLNDLTCESSDESKALIEEMFDEIDSVEVKDLKVEEKSKDDDKAEVQATGKAEIKRKGGEKEEDDFDETFQLKKKDGDWCIDTMAF